VTERLLVPAGRTQIELKVSNSRFIAAAANASSVEQARAFIEEIRAARSDASHNIPAYIIGHGASTIMHCSDDGEPSGTAGRPALAVLQGSGLGDVAVVITRYFGGTKLGTGGLVRAYSESMRSVLAELPVAEKVPCHICRVSTPYPLYEQVKRLFEEPQVDIQNEVFTDQVEIELQIAVDRFATLDSALSELSRGTLHLEIVQENIFAFLLVKEQ